jgi:Zn-finger nucleic acid-binding protein
MYGTWIMAGWYAMAPYRDAQSLLHCPRCGDSLEAIRDGLAACFNCRGVWLGTAAVTLAFGTTLWTQSTNAWWKRSLVCPVCNQEMAAIITSDTLVDRCPTHGLWLDAGELGRLLNAPAAEELTALYRQLAPTETMPEIAARQAIRDAERAEARRREFAAQVAAQQQREMTELEIGRLERELAALREQVRTTEAALAAARARLG